VDFSSLCIEAPSIATAALLQGELMHSFDVEVAALPDGTWELTLAPADRGDVVDAVFVVGRWLHDCGIASTSVWLDERIHTIRPIGQSLRQLESPALVTRLQDDLRARRRTAGRHAGESPVVFVAAGTTIALPLRDARRLVSGLRRIALLERGGTALGIAAASAAVGLESVLVAVPAGPPTAVPGLEPHATIAALDAIAEDEPPSSALAQLRAALERAAEPEG
jgi:hypothetical protein